MGLRPKPHQGTRGHPPTQRGRGRVVCARVLGGSERSPGMYRRYINPTLLPDRHHSVPRDQLAMAFKLVVLSALVAVASAGYLGAPAVVAPGAAVSAYGYGAPALGYAAHGPALSYAAPAVAKVAVDTDFDPNPSYSYAYDIQDALTGDSKGQQESRQGDVVQGSYSLTEPDGTRRTVEYTADPVNGFNAVVHKTPLAAPVAKVAVAAPAYGYAAPAVAKVAAPLGYASPLGYAGHGYAAPLGYAGHGYAAPLASKAYLG
uniref:(California timema) hypothetical protein n=1 Tax=Timema californicum TaxID=61474 RepID=A0A7R9J9T0_TIMCA|nr:unnamed protein product [Timema californicum]